MDIYIQFYNIKDSANRTEYGPFSSIVCNGEWVTGVNEKEQEIHLAHWDEDRKSYFVHNKSYPPFLYRYFEVVAK